MARRHPQLFHRWAWLEGEQRAAAAFDLEEQRVAGQRLARMMSRSSKAKRLKGEAAGFLVEVAKVETPAVALTAAVLADDAVEPAVEPARQVEIGAVDGQDERVVEDGR
jgi:hypothetical protein